MSGGRIHSPTHIGHDNIKQVRDRNQCPGQITSPHIISFKNVILIMKPSYFSPKPGLFNIILINVTYFN